SDIHYFGGMRELFGQFYKSLQTGSPLPIAMAEMRRVTALMDHIFEQCKAEEARRMNELSGDGYQAERSTQSEQQRGHKGCECHHAEAGQHSKI
ncbi:MAG: hypothetical protein R3C01_14865, partial [Planctomycetaceae bacterium]